MTGQGSNPAMTPRAAAQAQARQEREAAALRENLRRRKAQMRAKEDAPGQVPASPTRPATES